MLKPIRSALVYLYRFAVARPLLTRLMQRRYGIVIDGTARISPAISIPNGVHIEANAFVDSTAGLRPNCTVKQGSVLIDPAPAGAILAGNPAQPIAFKKPKQVEPASPPRLATVALEALLEHFTFDTVLDIGSGEGWHARQMLEHGKRVTCVDFGTSYYFKAGSYNQPDTIIGDFSQIRLPMTFDCVWMSHVLEHQPDPHTFLRKAYDALNENGILAVTVPPMKPEIVGGHVNLFNLGLLLYRLILAGFDCSKAHARQYGYNISVIVRKKPASLPNLDYDIGDIERLSSFFPFEAVNAFDGSISRINWDWPDRRPPQ